MRLPLAIIALTMVVTGIAYTTPAPENSSPPAAPTLPNPRLDPTFPSSNVEHWRADDEEIIKLGDGSFDKGIDVVGGAGFRLFAVTTLGDEGKAGWLIFKRQPWNAPVPRPRYEFKRIDGTNIAKLGEGVFKTGLQKIEQDRWELVAFTSYKTGDIGWYYFERQVIPPVSAAPTQQ